MTAPTLSERLRQMIGKDATDLFVWSGIEGGAQTILEAAAEIERLTSQLEAAGLGKAAESGR